MKTFNFFIVMCSLFLLIGCNQKKEQNKHQPTVITIGSFSKAVDYAPYLVAKNKGWFLEAFKNDGIQIKFSEFNSLPDINDALNNNKLDVVFEAESPAIISEASSRIIDVKDISCSLRQEIIVHKDSKIQSIKDLKGKKIAVLKGTSSHYGLLKILDSQGVSAKDVTIIDAIPPDARDFFEKNQVDAWAVWPPFTEEQIISGRGRTLIGAEAFIQSIMAVNEKFLKNYPSEFDKIDAVFDKAKKWISKNPKEAQAIVAKELGVDIKVVEMAWSKHLWSASLDAKIVKDVQNKADFLKEEGNIENSLDVAKDLIPLH